MHTAVRPWITTGIALVGASVIAVTPVAPPPQPLVPQVHIPQVHLPAVQLTASVADIFTFPAFRQYILNRIDDVVTLGVGLAGSAAGLGQSIVALPSTLVTATQQVLTGDLLGALTTVETYLVGSIVAVGEPTLAAIIERRQEALAVREAMQVAIPTAIIDVIGGFGRGADEIARAFIVAGQDLVDAVLSFTPGAIVSALVDGTQLVVGSFVGAGQHVVDGIVSAQQTIATALATQPAAEATTTFSAKISPADVTDVPDLSRKTAMVAVGQSTDTEDAEKTASESKKPVSTDTPKAKGDTEQSDTDSASDPSDTSDQPDRKSPNDGTEKKSDASPKHAEKKSDNDSQSAGANP